MIGGRPRSVIALANEQVSIIYACQLIGMELPDDVGMRRSLKVTCPFGEIYHRDGGAEASFRIYPDSNSAYCFSCAVAYTPVRLVVAAWDGTPESVAVELLERAGLRPLSGAAAWTSAARYVPAPDATLLAEALKIFCARIDPHWHRRQFDPPVAAVLSRCLALLDWVDTPAAAGQWLAGCKQVMTRTLTESDIVDVCQHSPVRLTELPGEE